MLFKSCFITVSAALAFASSFPALATSAVWDSDLAVTGSAGTGSGASAADPWLSGLSGSYRYAEWNFMSYPTDATPDIAGSGSLQETTGSAFATSGGNIYSFSDATAFTVTLAGLAGSADVWLRVGSVGTAPKAAAMLNGVSAISVLGFSAAAGGFGGDEREVYWKWSNVAAATQYTVNFGALESSMSLDQVAVYAVALPVLDMPSAPVPEPEGWALMLAGMGLVAAVARRRMA